MRRERFGGGAATTNFAQTIPPATQGNPNWGDHSDRLITIFFVVHIYSCFA